ncbi:MAG: hypothetical protein NTV87_12715 [Ignavibacteriae bacterium]|nr:hypothetical protein [Ignavibacteriota bacterium]
MLLAQTSGQGSASCRKDRQRKKAKNEKTHAKKIVCHGFFTLFSLSFYLIIFLILSHRTQKERIKKMKQSDKINLKIKKVIENKVNYFELSQSDKCKIFNKGSKNDKYEFKYKDMNEYLKDILNIK